jgi:uncharacterized iron-regulated protein
MKLMRRFIVLMFLTFAAMGFKSDLPAYMLYNAKGKAVSFSDMLADLHDADVVLFGEFHDNPIAHWMQYKLSEALLSLDSGWVMGAEMFESDNQTLINEYLQGIISEKNFEKEARLWPNYKTDYKPLMQLAKDYGRAFWATNIPRRYASAVYSSGLEGLNALDETALSWLPPLPIEVDTTLSQYKAMLEMGMGHGGMNLLYAQAIKDATMGWHIAKATRYGGSLIHYNGSFHSDFHQGIEVYINTYSTRPLKVKTLTCIEADDPTKWEADAESQADYVLLIDSDMTKTH